MKKLLAFFGLFALLLSGDAKAQGISSDGREYLLGMIYPSFQTQPSVLLDGDNFRQFYDVSALITSTEDNVVYVSYYDDNGIETAPQSFTIAANSSLQISLDTTKLVVAYADAEIPKYRSCHIVAEKPISLHYFSVGFASGGSYLALPLQCWGRKYVAMSYHDNPNGDGGIPTHEGSSGSLEVIASEDNTTVTITPTSTTSKGHAGVNCGVGSTGTGQPYSVQLNRGQCYLVRSDGTNGSCDLSGTTIVSDNPVAIISGHEGAQTVGSASGWDAVGTRNLLVQQMLPTEMWDTAGFYSLPFADSKAPNPGTIGDEYRICSGVIPGTTPSSPLSSVVTMQPNGQAFTVSPYADPISSITEVNTAVDFSTNDGVPFAVTMYDHAMLGTGSPFPMPTMMTIVPNTRWKTDFQWSVPPNNFEVLQSYYSTVICDRDDYLNHRIVITDRSGKISPLQTMALKRLFTTMPGNSTLSGYTIALPPGSYRATGIDGAKDFMIYNYGVRGADPDRDLGDFKDSDDFFFSYADPAGLVYKEFGADDPVVVAHATQTCNGWTIDVSDKGNQYNGLRYVDLMNYHSSKLGTSSVAQNVRIDPAFDPHARGEMVLNGKPTQLEFSVSRIDPQLPAHAVIAIYDNSGKATILDLIHNSTLVVSSIPDLKQTDANTFELPEVAIGQTQCLTFSISNPDQTAGHVITSLKLGGDNSDFAISASNPTLPTTLEPNGSMTVTVCYTPTTTTKQTCYLELPDECGSEVLAVLQTQVSQQSSVSMMSTTITGISASINGRQLHVNLPSSVRSHATIDLFDVLGRRIASWPITNSNIGGLDLTLPSMTSGMYVVRVANATCTVFN